MAALATALGAVPVAQALTLAGQVRTASGSPLFGAMVTIRHVGQKKETTVYTGAKGRYILRGLDSGLYDLRARREGYADRVLSGFSLTRDGREDFVLQPLGWEDWLHQLPANIWLRRVGFPSNELRGEFMIQCGMCHQQGSAATRQPRTDGDWDRVFDSMFQMGAMITKDLRETVPKVLNAAYTVHGPDDVPAIEPRVTRGAIGATVEEWEVGSPVSMLHDVAVGRDGRVYAVDWILDKVYALDPETGKRDVWEVPRSDAPPGGIMGVLARRSLRYTHAIPYVAPHSVQVAPDGKLWITLSLGRGLVKLDPATGTFTDYRQPRRGLYPHTLRFDALGRIWYTLAMSNHVARLDPASGRFDLVSLPTRPGTQWFVQSTVGFWLRLAQFLPFEGVTVANPEMLPIPYGLDVAPDGTVWFSQFNSRRIGRIDPNSLEVRTYDTPFFGPRRLRCDADGDVWIPAYGEGALYKFDPSTETFSAFPLPTGVGEMPYALNVHRAKKEVWICGSNSDSLIRFDIPTERFTVFPLPTRVTFCREVDFDEAGRVWTSNSNMPGWHVEGGQPKVIRLTPPRAVAAVEPGGAESGEVGDD
ncbi:MAG: carboxypeptidase regulatory-like domain-containing protein [Nitrospirae bacterium]|nr:carboxypeptidase regulatory-like domain-containing protein [Nitrospirota bacterium]